MDKQVEVDGLFRNKSIDEIKDAERSLRGEIEKKKEDLRVMVGERYRDLINAADIISQMKVLSEDVHGGINTIQKCCKDFKKRGKIRKRTTSEDIKLGNEEINFYSLATQMELLVGTPEKIWDSLDKQQFLLATQLYLLGYHIVNNSLHIDTGYGNQSDVFANFPILHHQWAAISHFKNSILKGSATSLKDLTLPDKALAESLCSMILLNDLSPRQVYMEFLLARKSAIQDVFHLNQHKSSIKRQICDITSLVILTLQQIFSLFYQPESQTNVQSSVAKGLLYETIHKTTMKGQSDQGDALRWLFGDEFDVLTVARHLPPAVSDFRPKVPNIINVVPLQTIRNGAKEWISGCIADIHEGVEKLLKYVKSIKHLGSIRDSVYEQLSKSRLFFNKVEKFSSDLSSHDAENWNELCDAVLDRRMSIWNELYDELYVRRSKDILDAKFNDAYHSMVQSTDETIAKLQDTIDIADSEYIWDRNVTSYLWNELPGDFPTSGWCMETTQGKLNELSSLTLKAKGCTPALKSLCQVLDDKLKEVVDDSKYLFEEVETNDAARTASPEINRFSFDDDVRIEPFEKFAGVEEKRNYIRDSTIKFIDRFCVHIEEVLDQLQSQLQNLDENDENYQSLYVDRMTLLGRLCMTIPQCCTNLKRLSSPSQDEARPILLQRGSRFNQKKGKTKAGTSTGFDKITEAFARRQNMAFRLWREWLVRKCFEATLKAISSPDHLLVYGTTCWEDISIQEEADTGNKVQSKIRVPSQVSSFVISLLFRVCEETNRIGGHVIGRSLVKELTLGIGNSILSNVDKFVNDNQKITQNQALQFIFDIRFLVLFFGGNSDTKDQEMKSFKMRGNALTTKLEGFVDPFDLDVFTPHMTNFIHRQIQRSWLLLGTISNIDKNSLPLLSNKSSNVSQEQHSTIPLVPNPVRFMLLPISTHQEKTAQGKMEDLKADEMKGNKSNQKPSIKCPLFEHLHQFTLEF